MTGERGDGGFDPSRGGRLGETPILWRFKMQYELQPIEELDDPDWDQCCTCWVFALSEGEARTKVWAKFEPPSVKPIAIAECVPERYENERDRELEAKCNAPPSPNPIPETPLMTELQARERDRRAITRMIVEWRSFKRLLNPFRVFREQDND